MAGIIRQGNVSVLMVLDMQLKPILSQNLGDLKVRGLEFAGDEIVLVHYSTTARLEGFTTPKAEIGAALIVPLNGGKPDVTFNGSRDFQKLTMGTYGLRQIDGRWKAYLGAMSTHDRGNQGDLNTSPALAELDLATNKARLIASAAVGNTSHDWVLDSAGKVTAELTLYQNSGSWKIANPKGQLLAQGTSSTGDVSLLSLGRDGTTLIYWIRDEDGETHLMETSLTGGAAPKELLPDEAIGQVYIDSASSRLLGYLRQGDKPQPVFFDPAQQAAMSKIYQAFNKSHLELIDYTPDFQHAIVETSGTGDAGTYYLVDVHNLKASPISSERPAIAPEQVGAVSVVEYKAADGLAMDGILTLPPGREAKNLPVILFPHGGPHAADEAQFDWWAQAFASRGYAVFQPNFRGSTGRGDAFRNAAYNEWGRKMQTDISDGLAELARRGIVDPKRACIMGGSYGGYAALAGVTLQQGLYRCAVAVAPVSDLSMMYRSEVYASADAPMSWRSMRKFLGDPSTYDANSPRQQVAKADAPILLVHGKDDTVVPFQQSEVMANALSHAGKPYEMVVLNHEDHWLSNSDTRLQMLTAATAFVEKYNPAN